MKNKAQSHDRRAVVIGGSIGGLLAGRVLSDHYNEVVILERDELSKDGLHRRGVPHGRHAHALLAGGQQAIEDLFPGISNDLISGGGVAADSLNDGTWFFEGAPLCKAPSNTTGVMSSRPFLESIIRKRVRRIDRMEIRESQSVRELLSYNGRVTGVSTESGPIRADLVVDATGRGSQTGKWLTSLGFNPAPEEKVEVQLMYCTRVFRPGINRIGNDEKFAVIAPTPDGKRGGVIANLENDRWIVTLFGHFGHFAPPELDGFMDFARSLPSPLIYDAIRYAEPIGEATQFRFPASTRKYYESLTSFPEGFAVFGDAICSFNPIYGQGMSVAALQAKALDETLATSTADVGRRFFKKASSVIDNAWKVSVGSDLKMPETIGPRTLAVRIINSYISNVHKHAHFDPTTALAFVRVAQLLDPPTSLMHPAMAVPVLLSTLRRALRKGSPPKESAHADARPSGQWRIDGL